MMRPLDTGVQVVRASFASIGLDHLSTRLGIALLVVSSIFFAANFADKAWVSYQVAQQRQQLATEIQQTRRQNVQLKSDLSYMHTRPYYIQAARQYGFVQSGDYPMSISTSPAPAAAAAPNQSSAHAVAPPSSHSKSLLRRLLEAVVPGL